MTITADNWPLFRGEASLRDLALALDPPAVERWIDLSFHIARAPCIQPRAYPDRYELELQLESRLVTAMASGTYRLFSQGSELGTIDWQMMRLGWSRNVLERLERVPGMENRPDQWPVAQRWPNVTVRCTDEALAQPNAAPIDLRRCPEIPTRSSTPVLKKRLLGMEFVVSPTSRIVVVSGWLKPFSWFVLPIAQVIKRWYLPRS